MGCRADGPYGPGVVHTLLEQLGVRQQCEFIPVQPFTSVRMPGLAFSLYSGRQAYIESLRSACPDGFEKLPELLALYGRIHQAGLAYYAPKTPRGLLQAAGPLAEALRYQNTTLESVLAHYLPQERSRRIAGALWPYLGLPPERASFVYWAILLATYIDEGAYFCKGGLHQLSQAVASACWRDGGELLLGSAVTRLLVQDGRVRGVEVAGGQRFYAPAVIADIDPRQAFGELVEPSQRPQPYLRKLGQMELSIRGINLSLVTDLDLPGLGFGYETLFVDNWDPAQSWRDMEAGRPSVFGLTMMDAADPDLAPPGQHLVSLFCSLPTGYDRSPENIRRTAAGLLRAADQQAPGLKDHLLLAGQGAAPAGYLTSVYEPIYGWASSPAHTALRRLGPRTPIHGLVLAGQWTRPGQGAMGVIFSGMEAANITFAQSKQES